MNIKNLRRILPLVLTLALFATVFTFGSTTADAAGVTGTDIAKYAKTLAGKPYKNNASGPSSFDNAGLTQFIYKQYGVNLGSSVSAQSKQGKLIKKGYAVKPGDLLFFALKGSTVDTVAIYLGNDQMLAVTSAGKQVKVYPTESYRKYYQGARRLTDYVKAPVVTPPSQVKTTKPTAPTTQPSAMATKITQASKKYLGVKYKLGANYDRDKSYMFDCSSFTQKVYADLGIKIPRTVTTQKKATKAISKSNLQVGDLVYFDLRGTGGTSHVGIYLGNGDFIHASTAKNKDVQISNLETMSYWKNRFHSASRVF